MELNDERRDIGPYQDAAQALRQFGNWQVGLPMTGAEAAPLVVLEATMLAGVAVTEFEKQYLTQHCLDPILATIVHGWLIRAKLGASLPSGNS